MKGGRSHVHLIPLFIAAGLMLYAAYAAFMLGYDPDNFNTEIMGDAFGFFAVLIVVLFFYVTIPLIIIGAIVRGLSEFNKAAR